MADVTREPQQKRNSGRAASWLSRQNGRGNRMRCWNTRSLSNPLTSQDGVGSRDRFLPPLKEVCSLQRLSSDPPRRIAGVVSSRPPTPRGPVAKRLGGKLFAVGARKRRWKRRWMRIGERERKLHPRGVRPAPCSSRPNYERLHPMLSWLQRHQARYLWMRYHLRPGGWVPVNGPGC